MNRSFSSSTMLQSVDNSHEERSFNCPHKLKQYQSITESTTEFIKYKDVQTCFMERWKASVVESIDFQAELKGVDLKERVDALNCAI